VFGEKLLVKKEYFEVEVHQVLDDFNISLRVPGDAILWQYLEIPSISSKRSRANWEVNRGPEGGSSRWEPRHYKPFLYTVV
jgi:hypothetical protein